MIFSSIDYCSCTQVLYCIFLVRKVINKKKFHGFTSSLTFESERLCASQQQNVLFIYFLSFLSNRNVWDKCGTKTVEPEKTKTLCCCRNIDVRTDATDKLVQSSNIVKFEAKSRSP